jgi:type II secretory pathway pseudopilin PulG
MLGSNRGFTIVQIVVAMTIIGLLGIWLGVTLAQQSWRNQQREHDLDVVAGMINRYPADHFGQYPDTSAASDVNSNLQENFTSLRLVDPSTGKYYILGNDFGPCNGPAGTNSPGLGYMSYQSPGQDGSPYQLRVCLEGGGSYYAAD